MISYNIDSGALEAMLFGLRNALLEEDDYHTLSQCESVADVQTFLCATDYAFFVQTDGVLSDKDGTSLLYQSIVKEFAYFRSNATGKFAQFLDFIVESYQLDNILKLIAGQRTRSSLEILTKCHPLGDIPVISAVAACESIADMLDILAETSNLERYFTKDKHIDFDVTPIEHIRALVQKNWIEEFYAFCQSVGGETAVVMDEILSAEADRNVITFTLNSMGGHSDPDTTAHWRRSVFPAVGTLQPIHETLANVRSLHDLLDTLREFPEFYEMCRPKTERREKNSGNTFESAARRKAVEVYRDAFTRQFHFGLFYAYVRLKSFEIDNIHWVIECIHQKMRNHIGDFLFY